MVLIVTSCCPVTIDLNVSITPRSIRGVINTQCKARSKACALTLMKMLRVHCQPVILTMDTIQESSAQSLYSARYIGLLLPTRSSSMDIHQTPNPHCTAPRGM